MLLKQKLNCFSFTVQVDLTNGYNLSGILPADYQVSKPFCLQFVLAKITAPKISAS